MSTPRIFLLFIFAFVTLWVVRSTASASTADVPAQAGFLPELRQDQIAAMTQALTAWRDQGLEDVFDSESGGQFTQLQDHGLTNPADAALRSAIIHYAQAQHGQSEVAHFPANWAIRPLPYDAEGNLTAALVQNRLADWLSLLPPPFKAYRDLTVALDRYRQIRSSGGWQALSGTRPLKEGMSGPTVRALRERLAREGYGMTLGAADDVFDPALNAAVAEFQRSHGLAPTGTVDKATRESLNVTADKRIEQITANLERWRWLPRDLPETRVEVNIAAATADLIVEGQPALSMRAIVGRPSDKTPMLEATIEAVVLNPPWIVPAKIAAREILPKARRDPDYLAREGFVLHEDSAKPGRIRVRQLPGDRNALGRIKFELPNPFDVYLHDTPTRQLFDRDRRALSHGCIRVEKPLDLALALLKDDPVWPPERVVQGIAEGATQRINLMRPVPVFLLYWTAFVDQEGVVNFRDDLYHWDEQLLHLREIG
jgi:murein L,D-transpeptidase YcbB/YkuD